MNELDRILLASEAPRPGAEFTARVMTAVRAEIGPRRVLQAWQVMVMVVALLLVSTPFLALAVGGRGALSAAGGGLSPEVLWSLALLVVTSVTAVLPIKLLEG